MGAWDFVVGIFAGILLACVSYVLQTSQVSAIREILPGGVANSTVRRHPIQYRFLQEAGKQMYVMKLSGYLFFGTIVGVEKQIRTLLSESFPNERVRFLVIDLCNVVGVDHSAVEAFVRIRRILEKKDVEILISGFDIKGDIGKALCNVGLFETTQYFETLNAALEYCENFLLRTFYEQQRKSYVACTECLGETFRHCQLSIVVNQVIDIPAIGQKSVPEEIVIHSPRRHHLHQVATITLSQQDPAPVRRWQDYGQPLQLILITFWEYSDKPEDFWSRLVPFLIRREFAAGSKLYDERDPANGFYLIETGMLRAEYKLRQRKFSELILTGTTCGELPFFSGTNRTSTTWVESDCVTWVLTTEKWTELQEKYSDIAQELLKISLKLTSERMDSITK